MQAMARRLSVVSSTSFGKWSRGSLRWFTVVEARGASVDGGWEENEVCDGLAVVELLFSDG